MNDREIDKTLFERAKLALMDAKKICIISHRGPDGDAVGSNLALKSVLMMLGKNVVSACVDPVPNDSMFLNGAETFVNNFNYEDFDAIVSVDCGALGLVKFHEKKPEILSGKKPFINFDHHGSNENYGTINIVQPESCATCFIIYKFLKYCGWPISRDVATDLLHGIYFDTGSLMHSNTTADVYKVAGELTEKGANVRTIVKYLFHTMPVNKMRLMGRILERAYVNEDGVTISAVNKDDYRACGATHKDTGGAIDFLNAVPGSKYCVLLSEDDEKGIVKGSLRTQKEDVNLSDVASKWGGGGHPKASGFGVEGVLKPVMKWKIESQNGKDVSFEF